MTPSSARTIIVTGSSSGIGEACARSLLERGDTVIGIDRSDRWRPQAGARFHRITCDLRDVPAAKEAVREAAQFTGRIDGLVNSAGVGHFRRIQEIPIEEWDELFDVNVRALFYVAVEAAEIMAVRGGGRIINLGSNAGRKGRALAAHYAATKAAVKSISESLALAYGPKGISVNTVCPAVTLTPMWDEQFEDLIPITGKKPDELVEAWKAQTPLRRLATTGDIVALILHLLSDEGFFITAQEINVCGGFMLTC